MSSSQIERKLAAIMFTDIAGYTALSAKDENKALALLDKQEQILTPIIEEFNGTLHNRVGDGLLFTFPTVTDAVKCGIKIQKETNAVDDLNLRIGIHEGEITIKDGDALGDDVNVASRIDPFAAEGGIVISGKVQQNISSLPEFETTYVGTPKLKGVAQKVEVYCITSHGLPKTDISKVTAKLEDESNFNIYTLTGGILTAIGIAFWIAVGVFDVSFGGKAEVPSVGILMMENLGKEDEIFWSSGMTADLITKVAGAGLIRVAPLDDILKLDKDLSIEEKAEKLRVKYILTHSFLIKDDGFDLWCKLENIGNGVALFSNKISEPMDMTTQMVGKLANDIITSLKVKTVQDVMKAPTTNTEAYKYYLEAEYIYDKRKDMKDIEIARGLYQKAIELDDNLIKAKTSLGWTYSETGDYDKAMDIYTSVLKQAEELGDKSEMEYSLSCIGNASLNQFDYEKALDYFKRSLTIAEELGDKYGIGASLNNIGNVYFYKGDYEKALDYYERSLAILEELGNKSGIGYNLNSIGLAYSYKGDYDKALDYFKRSLKIDEELGNKSEWSLNNIGLVYWNKGDYEKALDYYERSLAIREELGNKRGMGYSLNSIGNVHSDKGDYDKAMDYYERSLTINEELGYSYGMGRSLGNIGNVYYNKGDLDTALDYYERSLAIREELGDKSGMRRSLNSIGLAYSYKSDYNKALDYFKRSLKIAEELGNKSEWSLNNIGLVYWNKGDYEKAEEYLEKSLSIQKEIGLGEGSLMFETTTSLYLCYKILGKDYDVKEIHTLIKETNNIEYYLNYYISQLLEDTSYLETAYNQVQEKAENLEPDIKAKFLSYPIPKAIVEEWDKVK